MPVLKVADPCCKAGPVHGFGLLLFHHQAPSYETFMSLVGCLVLPQGISVRSRYGLSQKSDVALLAWAPLPASLLHPGLAPTQGIPPPLPHEAALGSWCSELCC